MFYLGEKFYEPKELEHAKYLEDQDKPNVFADGKDMHENRWNGKKY